VIDLSKAFDTISHKILLSKLSSFGIMNIPAKWIGSFLQSRLQRVRIHNSYSVTKVNTMGVPQGSVLGPLFFLLYINDLPIHCPKLTMGLFADDTTVTIEAKTVEDAYRTMQFELDNLCSYFSRNGLVINNKKSTDTLFHTRRPFPLSSGPTLLLNGQTIPKTKCMKYLGVIFDSSMTWNLQLTIIHKKLSRSFAIIKRLAPLVDSGTVKSLYYALFNSYLFYSNLAWGHQSINKLKKINDIQKHTLQYIFKSHPDLISTFHPPTVTDIHFKLLNIFFFKVRHKLLPRILQTYYDAVLNPIQQTISTRRGPAPFRPRPRTDYGLSSLSSQLIVNYQSICSINEDCLSLIQLKTKLKRLIATTTPPE